MLIRYIEDLSLRIKQIFQDHPVTTLHEIVEKMNQFKKITKIDEEHRQIIVFRTVDLKFELTCVVLFNKQSQVFFSNLPQIEDSRMCNIFFQLQNIGFYLQESNYISLTDLILQKKLNKSTIHQLFIDLITQIFQLHKQQITINHITIDNIFYNKILNKFCLKYLFEANNIQIAFNYQINDFCAPELKNQGENINPYLIDTWNLGILILQIFKIIHDDNCNDLSVLLQKYFINLGGLDYIFINGFYYKNQNHLLWLLEENQDNRPSLENFILNTGCLQLSNFQQTNVIDLNQTLKKCFLKNKIFEVKSIIGNKINLHHQGEGQIKANNQINLELGILKINNQQIRANLQISIYHDANQIIIPELSCINTIFHVIHIFYSFGNQIDAIKLLKWIQIQVQNSKKLNECIIKHGIPELNLPITLFDYEPQKHSIDQIEGFLKIFPKMNLTRLSLQYSTDHIVQFFTKKVNLSSLRILDLSNSLIEDINFINCEQLSHLNISNCRSISPAGLLSLFKNSTLCNMVTLNVSSTQCNDVVFEAIWKNKSFQALSSLNYSNCSFVSPSFISQVIAQLNCKQEQIIELYLSHCHVTNQILMALQQINNLIILDISENKQINEWHNLKRDNKYHLLNLESCNLSKQDIYFLFGFECLQNCKILISEQKQININRMSITRFVSLKNIKAEICSFSPIVQEICLDNCEISNIEILLQQQMKNLSILSLQNCNLTDKSIEHLINNESLKKNLESLNLNQNILCDVSLISILNKLHLRRLYFNETQISDLSITSIIQAQLQFLSLQGCQITPNGFLFLMNKDIKIHEIDISRNNINYELQYFLMNDSYNFTIVYDRQFNIDLLRTFSKNEAVLQLDSLDLSRRANIQQNFQHLLSTNILTKINLSYTFIKDSEIETISIWCSETLSQLLLQGCQSLTNQCLKYLKLLKKLKTIDLSDTFIKESECILLNLNNHKSS